MAGRSLFAKRPKRLARSLLDQNPEPGGNWRNQAPTSYKLWQASSGGLAAQKLTGGGGG